MSWGELFANGTTALAAAIATTTPPGGRVAIPAASCPSVAAAVFAVDRQAVFVDIEADTLGLCPTRLGEVVETVDAVVAVHAAGLPCRIEAIAAVCGHIPLIEDCAQAEGAETASGPVGSTGAIAVFSYGVGKILDLGGGGRAETRDAALAQGLSTFAHGLGEGCEHFADDLGHAYKFLYNRFFPDRLRHYPFLLPGLLATCGKGALGRAPSDLAARIATGRARLPAVLAERRRKFARYARALANCNDVRVIDAAAGAAPWRLNLLLVSPTLRDRVLHSFLAEGRKISSWYPDITLFLGNDVTATDRSVSRRIGGEILNLWLDDNTTDADIDDAVVALGRLLVATV